MAHPLCSVPMKADDNNYVPSLSARCGPSAKRAGGHAGPRPGLTARRGGTGRRHAMALLGTQAPWAVSSAKEHAAGHRRLRRSKCAVTEHHPRWRLQSGASGSVHARLRRPDRATRNALPGMGASVTAAGEGSSHRSGGGGTGSRSPTASVHGAFASHKGRLAGAGGSGKWREWRRIDSRRSNPAWRDARRSTGSRGLAKGLDDILDVVSPFGTRQRRHGRRWDS